MSKKLCIAIFIILFVVSGIFIFSRERKYTVAKVISPTEIVMHNGMVVKLEGIETFDNDFSERNRILGEKFGLTEEEAVVFGNFGTYWATTLLRGRTVKIIDNDLVYYPFNYKYRLMDSAFGIVDGKFTNEHEARELIRRIKYTNYALVDLDKNEYYMLNQKNIKKNRFVIRKGYKKKKAKPELKTTKVPLSFQSKDIKMIISDFSTKFKPDRKCNTEMCKEILTNINQAQKSIDMAIYGYSSVPDIEKALRNAKARGVNIRLVYDLDTKGKNLYADTSDIVNLINNARNDGNSKEANNIMHNKFYIIDDKIVITGSANLSYTDMSGYNGNVIAIISSPELAKIYKREFEQMYTGKFHNSKESFTKSEHIYFSPQDKSITNGILPYLRNAKKYIYIPTFLITENRIAEELINAHKKGIEIKIITDALNSASKYSKIRELRAAGIQVKIENFAGKMHSKSIIIDDKYLIIGSMNFSYYGENKNDENMIILENPEIARFYKNYFLYLWNKIPDKWLKGYPRAESLDSIGSCSDGIDNNYDGLIDSQDEGCGGERGALVHL